MDVRPILRTFHGINVALAVAEIGLAVSAAVLSYLASRADAYSRQTEVCAHEPVLVNFLKANFSLIIQKTFGGIGSAPDAYLVQLMHTSEQDPRNHTGTIKP